MICSKKPSIQTKPFSSQQLNFNQQHLVARWKQINGKLTCQWVMTSIK
jgi:hypothetical protein